MYDKDKEINILIGDARTTLKEIPDNSVNCVVTSPPYFGLRSYLDNDSPDKPNEIGMEDNPEKYIDAVNIISFILTSSLFDIHIRRLITVSFQVSEHHSC